MRWRRLWTTPVSESRAISDLTSSPHPISFCPRRCRLAFFLHSMFKLNLSILNHFISIFQAFTRMRMQFEIFLPMSTFLFNHLLTRCLSVLDFWNVNLGVYYKLEKNGVRNKLDFLSSSNLIFTACVACKNQFRNQIF